jgi:hypothetical protein
LLNWPLTGGVGPGNAAGDGRAHVLVAVTVRQADIAFARNAWSARIVFTLEAGEQLAGVARDLASVLAW